MPEGIGYPDNSAALEAFRRRAGGFGQHIAGEMGEINARMGGRAAVDGGGLDAFPTSTSPRSVTTGRSPRSSTPNPKNILSKVGGDIDQPEMIEVLISRLKKLLPKDKPK